MAKKEYHLFLRGYVGGYDFDREYVNYVLEKNKGKHVDVLVESLGGEVSTAFSIAGAFARHGDVSVHFSGMNASAATIASMGAKRISMDSNAMYLVHKVSTTVFEFAQLNADELRRRVDEMQKDVDDLDKIDNNIASMYASKCKKKKAELMELMRKGGWLSAKEALEWGFVDEITDFAERPPVLDEVTVSAMASAGIPIPDLHASSHENAFTRFMRAMGAFFNITEQQNESPMKKTFENVCRLLACKDIESVEGKITVTDEQMQKIEEEMANACSQLAEMEKQLNEKDTELSSLKEKVSRLETDLESLKKEPADTTQQVQAEDGKENADEYTATIAGAVELLKQVKS